MTIEILDKAENDLVAGFHFYEEQEIGLGTYFLESLYSDIESLKLYAGIHRLAYRDFHRMLSKRFPFAIYYRTAARIAYVHAVVDCRKSPAWIRDHLT
ncbi:MAG: type II toxin-antitoxin system RelE/ParE family toxin [Verrucomicrobia bacterium]|nr:type II toxin-antitoxin system RelE/ParE family toxin [Verrucomicrobiota bacterium]